MTPIKQDFYIAGDIFIEPANFKSLNSLGYCTLEINFLYFLKFNKLDYIIKFKHIIILKIITLFMFYLLT